MISAKSTDGAIRSGCRLVGRDNIHTWAGFHFHQRIIQMNDSTEAASGGRTPIVIGGIVGIGAVLLLIMLFRGSSDSVRPLGAVDSSSAEETTDQCERTLGSALDGLRPHRLGLSSESRVMVNTLNDWLNQCGAASASDDVEWDVAFHERLLTESGFQNAQQTRYQEWDAAHVRNGLLAKTIVDNTVGDLRTDRERAVELFYYVVRTVELIPQGAFPQTPYESLLFGKGTAEDRAWVFALLLRQLRLECVVLQPRDQPTWLLGVIIPGEDVDLFDPRLGLPIAAPDDRSSPLPKRPASLTQVLEDDVLLRQYDLDGARYPLTAESLKDVDVVAVGTSSTWSTRMERLQLEMEEPVELFDGLGAGQLRETGLYDRIVDAGRDGLWAEDRVGVWPYPESCLAEAGELTNQQQKLLDAGLGVLEGPYEIKLELKDGVQQPVAEGGRRTLHHARIDQLLGKYGDALPFYVHSRIKFQDFNSIQLPEVTANYLGADLATYWAAQSQFEQRDYQAALNSAELYLKQRPNGQFRLAALYLASLSLAYLERPEEASGLLSTEPQQAPQYAGDQMLVARWKQGPTTSEEDVEEDSTAEETSPQEAADRSSEDEQPGGAAGNDEDPSR